VGKFPNTVSGLIQWALYTVELWCGGLGLSVNPNRGHSSILMRLRQSDPIFIMGVDVMRPAYNFEPQYRVTMLMREDWTKATRAPPAKGSSGLQMGPR